MVLFKFVEVLSILSSPYGPKNTITKWDWKSWKILNNKVNLKYSLLTQALVYYGNSFFIVFNLISCFPNLDMHQNQRNFKFLEPPVSMIYNKPNHDLQQQLLHHIRNVGKFFILK